MRRESETIRSQSMAKRRGGSGLAVLTAVCVVSGLAAVWGTAPRAQADPCGVGDTCPPGQVCLDGECVRQGLKNPLGAVDSALRRAVRRDDEILLVGPAGNGIDSELGLGQLPGEAKVLGTATGMTPIVGAVGRIIGPVTEQAAIVYKPTVGAERHLQVHDLFAEDLPALSRYSFTPANGNSRIDVAVGDLDNIKEPFPSEEFHHEVALVYEVNDAGTRRAKLTVLSFEDIEPPCGQVFPPPDPTQETSVLISTPLQFQDGTANQMAVEVGDYDNDFVRDIAVAIINGSGVVEVHLFSVVVDSMGARSIVTFAPDPPINSNCCFAHDSPGCTSGNPDDFNDCADAVCAVPGFEYCCGSNDGVWDQGCADKAAELGATEPFHACYLCAFSVPSFESMSEAKYVELIASPDLDSSPSGAGDHLAVVAIRGTTPPTGTLDIRVYSYNEGSGEFDIGSEGRAQIQPDRLGMVGATDVDVLLNGRVHVSVGQFPGIQRGATNSLAVLVDTNFGPVFQVYGFEGDQGSDTGPIYDNPYFENPIWPTQTELDSRAMTTMPTNSNAATGSYVMFRYAGGGFPQDDTAVIISHPETDRLFLLPFDANGPQHNDIVTLTDPDTMMPFAVEPLPVMAAVDLDGDSGYYTVQPQGGARLFLGEPTLYTVNGIESFELILQEPPKHVDYLPQLGGIFNISQTDDFYTQFASTTQQQEEASETTTTDFTVSETFQYNVTAEVGFKIKIIDVGVEQSVGQTFTSTHNENTMDYQSETSSITLTQTSRAERDDQLIVKAGILDVWRYPVMGVIGVDESQQELPAEEQPENPQYDIVIPGPLLNTFGPGRLNDEYQPYHQNGYLLSYPLFEAGSFEPEDVGTFQFGSQGGGGFVPDGSSNEPIWAENAFIVGGLTASLSLQFSNTIAQSSTVQTTDTYKESLDSKTKASVGGSKGIFSAKVTAEFNYNVENTDSFSFAETARTTTSTTSEIAINVPAGIPAERGYKFHPAWYVTPGGSYKVTHAVSTSEAGQAAQIFWEENYALPDAALNMPHRVVADADIFGNTFYRLGTDLSRKKVKGFFVLDADGNELISTPAEGDLLNLDLRVYNLSVGFPVCNLKVRFEAQEYRFGQEIGPRILIGETVVPHIPSRASDKDAIPCDGPVFSCSADLTGDLVVNQFDVAPFVALLLGSGVCTPGPGCCAGDFNSDLLVNGDDIEPFVATLLGQVDTGLAGEEPGAPPNMRRVSIAWDTTGFGPPGETGIRRWLIYATLDPDNDIPNEVHELVDRFDDALRNPLGQPLDPAPGHPPGTYLEKGQNNTGWTQVSIAAPPPVITECEAAGGSPLVAGNILGKGADVRLAANAFVVIDPATGAVRDGPVVAYAGETLTFRVTLTSDKVLLKNRYLRIFEGSPKEGGRMIANLRVWGVDRDGSTQEFFTWQPEKIGRYALHAVFDETPHDPAAGNAVATLELDVRSRSQLTGVK